MPVAPQDAKTLMRNASPSLSANSTFGIPVPCCPTSGFNGKSTRYQASCPVLGSWRTSLNVVLPLLTEPRAIGVLQDTETVLTQVEPQATLPAGQVVQVPFTQSWLFAQTTPQPPQLVRSVFVSVHAFPQLVRPVPQSTWQLPATQA